jgi:GR25 family glycosyltransferase involved in LPS biosynthesis
MKPKVPIYIASMRNSPRIKILLNRLKKLNLKYKIFYGITGKTIRERKLIYDQYDRSKVLKYLGRDMGFNEIGGMYTILRMLKYAQKKKLENVIIFDDDFYPSSDLKNWINKRVYFRGCKIVQFHCAGSGFLEKKYINILNNKRRAYFAKTHLNNFGAGQITKHAIKKYLQITKGKTIGVGDYPFNLKKNKIELLQVLPFLGYPDDRGKSYLHKDRKNKNKNISFAIFKKIKKIITLNLSPDKAEILLDMMRVFYYLLLIPFILRKIKNFSYYNEIFFQKNLYKVKNLFFNQYMDVKVVHNSKKSYPIDLEKYYYKKKKY